MLFYMNVIKDGVNGYYRVCRACVTSKHVDWKWARLLTSGRRVADYYFNRELYEVASACLNHASATQYLAMTTPIFLLVASSLLGCGKAISDRGFATASAMSDLEHYCFPRSGGPFSANGVWPSVTMMYSGTTLLTTPTMISICGTTPTVAPGLPIDGTVRSAGSTATSSTSGASPDSNISKSVAGSAAASPGPGFSLDASLQSSLASAASLNTLTTGSVLETSSRAVPATPTPDADGGNGSAISSGTVAVSGSATALSGIGQSINASTLPTPPIGSGTLTVSGSATTLSGIGQSINASTLPTPPIGSGTVTASGSATDLSSSGQSVNVPALLTPPISTNTGFGGPSAAVSVTTTDSRFPLGSDMAAISSGNYALTQTGVESKSTLAAGTQASASGGLAGPTGATPGADATQQNGTISLSSPAVDALQLALFMKNLGAAVFNTSRVLLTRSGREKRDTALLVKLVSDISVVSSFAFPLFSNPFTDLNVQNSKKRRKRKCYGAYCTAPAAKMCLLASICCPVT
jgi:hypothetical protein